MNADIDGGRGFAERITRLLERGNAAPGDIEAAAFGRKRMRHRETNPLAGPGDERALPLEPQIHRRPPSASAHCGALATIKSIGHRVINSSHAARGKGRAPQPVSA